MPFCTLRSVVLVFVPNRSFSLFSVWRARCTSVLYVPMSTRIKTSISLYRYLRSSIHKSAISARRRSIPLSVPYQQASSWSLVRAVRWEAPQNNSAVSTGTGSAAICSSRLAQDQQQHSATRRDPWGLPVVAGMVAALASVAMLSDNVYERRQSTDCCGIAGVVGRPAAKHDARDFLLEGLTVLKNRGYDSAGLATIDINNKCNKITVTKYASNGDAADGIELVKERSLASSGHFTGIAHTRWVHLINLAN